MILNTNYAEIAAQTRINKASTVSVERNDYIVQPIPAQKDTVTISDAALAKMNGYNIDNTAPTYIKPKTAQALLAENSDSSKDKAIEKSASDIRFDEMMQNLLDKRLGIDREKLKEIDAMMEEIANNENLSEEQKQKALEELEKMKEKIIEESIKIKETAAQTFNQEA